MTRFHFVCLMALGLTFTFVSEKVRYAIGATVAKITYKSGEKVVNAGKEAAVAVGNHIRENVVMPEEPKPATQTIVVQVVQGETKVLVNETKVPVGK